MPRQARIDVPGALHHIVIRGIEHRNIFKDDKDRINCLDRLAKLLSVRITPCHAWALMSSHAHQLLRSGAAPISRKLWIPCSHAARKQNIDHSTVSRAVQKVEKDAEMIAAADTMISPVDLQIMQH